MFRAAAAKDSRGSDAAGERTTPLSLRNGYAYGTGSRQSSCRLRAPARRRRDVPPTLSITKLTHVLTTSQLLTKYLAYYTFSWSSLSYR